VSVTVGDAVVYYRGDNTDAIRKMDDTEKRSRGWASRVGGIVKTGMMAGTVAVVGLGAAMTKLAFDAMPLEGIQKAFDGITGGAEDTLLALRKGSLGMVKDAELMRNYNEAAQLVGKSFADELPEAMKYLGKVSAATGQDMGYLMDSLTKGVGRLSPVILDNLQIQVSAAEANEAYAVTLGKSVEEMTKSEKQTAMMNQVMEKLAENTKDMPDITENAATKWAQLKTVFGNVKDEIGLALLPALTSVLGTLAEQAPIAIDKAKAAFGELRDLFAEKGFLGGLQELGSRFWDWLTGEHGAINAGVFLIQHRFAPQIAHAFSQAWPVIWKEISTWPGKFWEWLTAPETGALAKASTELGALVTTITTWSTDSSGALKEAGDKIGQLIVDGIVALFGKTETGESAILAFLEALTVALLTLDVAIAKAGADIGLGIAGKIAEAVGGPAAKKLIVDKLGEMLKGLAVDVALGPFGPLIRATNVVPGYGLLPNMASGGTVPGAPGTAVPIMAHGQERVIPYDQEEEPRETRIYITTLNLQGVQDVSSFLAELEALT